MILKIKKKNKLDLTVLLIPRLLFLLTKYQSLATLGHDENLKKELKKKRRERCPKSNDLSPFYTHQFLIGNLPNLLKHNNIQIWLIKNKRKFEYKQESDDFGCNFRAPDLETASNHTCRPKNIPKRQLCKCGNFKSNFDLDVVSISQNAKHESYRSFSYRSKAS